MVMRNLELAYVNTFLEISIYVSSWFSRLMNSFVPLQKVGWSPFPDVWLHNTRFSMASSLLIPTVYHMQG